MCFLCQDLFWLGASYLVLLIVFEFLGGLAMGCDLYN